MSDENKRPTHDGYRPEILKKGYQPEEAVWDQSKNPKPDYGYQPSGNGTSPTNPTPPKSR